MSTADPTEQLKSLQQWLLSDIRLEVFSHILFFIDNEMVEGDIVEFGVCSGRSLALLSYCHQQNLQHPHFDLGGSICERRKVVGFDGFSGLPRTDGHPRWHKGLFSHNGLHANPLIPEGSPLNAQAVFDLFKALRLPEPVIEVGLFEQTTPGFASRYPKVALVHIDCDLGSATQCALEAVAPCLQEGTVLLFDDFFCFKGSPHQGERGAFQKFLKDNRQWRATPYKQYSTYSKSFILNKA